MVYLLLAVFAIVALAPLGSVAYRLIDGSREALKTSQQEYQHLLASTISRELDVYVGGLRAQLTRGSHSLAKVKGGADAVADEAIRQVLDEVVDERVLYLRFTDLRGRVLQSRTTEPLPGGLEPLFLNGFRAAAESLAGERGPHAGATSPPILLPGNPPSASLLLTLPVVSGGRFLGRLGAGRSSVRLGHRDGRHSKEPHAMFAVDAAGHLLPPGTWASIGPRHGGLPDREEVPGQPGPRVRDDAVRLGAPQSAAERYLGSYEVSGEGWGVRAGGERQISRR
jgi:hypothetical protein